MRACVHACVCACVRVCVNIDVFLILLYYHDQDAKSSYTVMIDSHIVLLCIQLLFVDDHRIALDEIYMEFSGVHCSVSHC